MSEWGDISICWSWNQDNVSEWDDMSICWSGIRIMCPSEWGDSEPKYLSVGPESG